MGFKVILTPQSQADLKAIVTFIAKDNSDRARTYGNELIDRVLSIATFPELGRIVPEMGDAAVREVVHGSYRIIYEVFPEPNQISISYVFGTAREASRRSSHWLD